MNKFTLMLQAAVYHFKGHVGSLSQRVWNGHDARPNTQNGAGIRAGTLPEVFHAGRKPTAPLRQKYTDETQFATLNLQKGQISRRACPFDIGISRCLQSLAAIRGRCAYGETIPKKTARYVAYRR